jgi:hypothetical protein
VEFEREVADGGERSGRMIAGRRELDGIWRTA